VGDPFKDTSSVALNPVIKFTTLFGLLAVELAVSVTANRGGDATLTHILAGVFFLISLVFVWRSFYGMRIGNVAPGPEQLESVGEMGTDREGVGVR
jgi:K(+)-stimulated pyrophosphate-energized sodium pump